MKKLVLIGLVLGVVIGCGPEPDRPGVWKPVGTVAAFNGHWLLLTGEPVAVCIPDADRKLQMDRESCLTVGELQAIVTKRRAR